MPKAVIEIDRTEVGDQNFVLRNFDYFCEPIGVPPFDILFLVIHEGASISNTYYPGRSGVHFALPLPLSVNFSTQELQIYTHWIFERTKNNEQMSLDGVSEYHGLDLVLTTLLKAESILRLWMTFSKSSRYRLLASGNSSRLLSVFEKTVLKPRLKNAVTVSLAEQVFLKKQLERLSKVKLEIVLENAAKASKNSIFDLSEREFSVLVARLFREHLRVSQLNAA